MESMREQIRKAKVTGGEKAELPWASYRFDEKFSGFDGHFPGQPILPGVFMVMAAVVTLEDWLACDVRVLEVHKTRFVSPIIPGQELEVRCRQYQQRNGSNVAQFTLRGAADRKTSECMLYVDAHG